MSWLDPPVFDPLEQQREVLAFQLRQLERSDPKRAKRLMYLNPELLAIRRAVAEAALKRRM